MDEIGTVCGGGKTGTLSHSHGCTYFTVKVILGNPKPDISIRNYVNVHYFTRLNQKKKITNASLSHFIAR